MDLLPLVGQVFKDECDSCPWYEFCLDLAGPGVASAQITSGRVSVREWLALDQLGVSSTADLAALDLDEATFQAAAYLPGSDTRCETNGPAPTVWAALRLARGLPQAGLDRWRDTHRGAAS